MMISIAMATYNAEKFLNEQLQSLANQVALPIELVVCDDQSVDSTAELVRSFSSSRRLR